MNEIIGIYDIKTNDINEDINLLNYFDSNKEDFQNSIDLLLDDQIIDFGFQYKFQKEKQYTLIFKIKKIIENLRNMFSGCSSLTSLNLSNFNTNNVTNMTLMFFGIKKDCNLICNDKKILKEFSDK